MKTLLILTGERGDFGYCKTASVIAEQLDSDNMRVVVLDASNMGDKMHRMADNSGGMTVFHPRMIWRLVYSLVSKHPASLHNLVAKMIMRNFLQILQRENPDVILSIHCGFNGSILDILHKYNINIPYMTFIDDLVSLKNTRVDKRANFVLVATDEAEQICSIYGYSPRKIKNVGYPVSKRFTNDGDFDLLHKTPGITTYFIASDDENICGDMRIAIKKLLYNGNCKINLVAKKTKKLRQRLRKLFGAEYANAIELYSYSDNLQDVMQTCDVAIIQECPSTIMECIASALPIILIGASDTSKGNMYFLTNNTLGLSCPRGKDILYYVNKLYRDSAKLYKITKKNQVYYNLKYGNGVDKITKFIGDFAARQITKTINKSNILCAENLSSHF